jgi:hypothetical protein
MGLIYLDHLGIFCRFKSYRCDDGVESNNYMPFENIYYNNIQGVQFKSYTNTIPGVLRDVDGHEHVDNATSISLANDFEADVDDDVATNNYDPQVDKEDTRGLMSKEEDDERDSDNDDDHEHGNDDDGDAIDDEKKVATSTSIDFHDNVTIKDDKDEHNRKMERKKERKSLHGEYLEEIISQ